MEKKFRDIVCGLAMVLSYLPIFGQDVMMQGWYWEYPKTPNGHLWADTLYQKAKHLADAGFTHLWLPPLSRTSSGSYSNGYDPQDLYDLGEFGGGATGFGSRQDVDRLMDTLLALGIDPVADAVYNHRDGGAPEANPAVEGWIENLDCTKINNGEKPFPSDRYRCRLPIGGSTGLGAGSYFIKVKSRSGHPNFVGYEYKFSATTNRTGWQNLPDWYENEANNDGGGCGQGSDVIGLGRNMVAQVDGGGCGNTCGVDEFELRFFPFQYFDTGDNIYINLTNTGGYSDHYISEIYYNGTNIVDQLIYETFTDFTQMPSGRGGMNYLNFKPNGNATNLGGEWDYMYFYYDYDQFVQSTADTLEAWTRWLWQDVGFRGLRIDAIKHFTPEFVGNLLDDMHDAGYDLSMVVGEFFDNNASILNNWVNDVYYYMDSDTRDAIKARIFDFSLRQGLKDACDTPGFDVRNLYNTGIVASAGGSPDNVITFCNNHDFRYPGEPIWNDVELAYAYMMFHGNIGDPCVFYPDYFGSTIPEANGERLANDIDLMIDAKTKYIDGDWASIPLNAGFYTQHYTSGFEHTTIALQIKGGGNNGNQDALAIINFSGTELDMTTTIEGTNINNGDTFQDVIGKALTPELVVNNYEVRIKLPARSFALFVKDPLPTCSGARTFYVDQSASGQGNGLSWEDASPNVYTMLAKASVCSEVDSILVAEGAYPSFFEYAPQKSFILENGITLMGGFPAGGGSLSSYDPQQHPSILSGQSAQSYHVVKNVASSDTSSLIGFTIEKGSANGPGSLDQAGGGLLNQGRLRLTDCIFQENTANSNPESILNTGINAYLEMDNVETRKEENLKKDIINSQGAKLLIRNHSSRLKR